jgi:hypothetical protein
MSDIQYFLHVSETGCVFFCMFFCFAGSRDIGSGCHNPMVAAGGIGTGSNSVFSLSNGLVQKWGIPGYYLATLQIFNVKSISWRNDD